MKKPVWHVIEQAEAACAKRHWYTAMKILEDGLQVGPSEAYKLMRTLVTDPKEGRAQIEIVHMTK